MASYALNVSNIYCIMAWAKLHSERVSTGKWGHLWSLIRLTSFYDVFHHLKKYKNEENTSVQYRFLMQKTKSIDCRPWLIVESSPKNENEKGENGSASFVNNVIFCPQWPSVHLLFVNFLNE